MHHIVDDRMEFLVVAVKVVNQKAIIKYDKALGSAYDDTMYVYSSSKSLFLDQTLVRQIALLTVKWCSSEYSSFSTDSM